MTYSRLFWYFCLICCFTFQSAALAADKKQFTTKPTLNNGEKWRIAYYEGGPFDNYPATLIAMVYGLMERGWIEKAVVPDPESNETVQLWNWISTQLKSDYIEFIKNAHYTANWNKLDKNDRKNKAEKIINRLSAKKDIDLMIAMGTWAGQDLGNNKHSINTVVCSTSDPVRSKIIISKNDSGFDHLHARIDPTRYQRQIKVFHEIIGFKKLGIAFRDTVSGRSYAAIADVEKMAQDLGFEIVQCHVPAGVSGKQEEQALQACYKKIVPQVDAVYVTVQTGVNKHTIKDIVEIFNSNNTPTFSQKGIKYVRRGLLMSISQAGLKYVGDFHAETIAKIFNGAKPGELDQVFKEPLSIAINLKTAELIGYDPSVDVIGAADQIFEEIEVYKKKK